MIELFRRWLRRSYEEPSTSIPEPAQIETPDELALYVPLFANLLQEAGFLASSGHDCVFFDDLQLQLGLTPVWSESVGPGPRQLRGFKLGIVCKPLFDRGLSIEYAYGWGETDDDVAAFALRSWIAHDFPVIHDALLRENRFTSGIEFVGKAASAEGAGPWRIYLGPMYFYSKTAGAEPCCDGCLFVGITDELMTLMQSGSKSCGVKLFASKTADGHVEADCRINGEDWEAGQRALISHARTWAVESGITMRRQYLYFQALGCPSGSVEAGVADK